MIKYLFFINASIICLFKMKTFLTLGFYLIALAYVSSRSLTETPSLLRLPITGIQKQWPRALLSSPRAKVEEKMKRIIYLKHLMELKCLKNLYDEIRYKNRIRYLRPYKIAKPLRIPVFNNIQDQISYFNKMKQNTLNSAQDRIKNFGNNRIILLPSNMRLIGRQMNKIQRNKTSPLNLNKGGSENVTQAANSEKKQSMKFSQAHSLVINERKKAEKFGRENSRFADENIPKASSSYIKMHEKPKSVKSPPRIYSTGNYHFQQQNNPIFNRPYDLEETIKEDVVIDLIDQDNSDDLKDRYIVGKTYLKSSVLERGRERKSDKMKHHATDKDINKSINTVLKTLMRSEDSTTDSKEIFNNSSFADGYLTPASTYFHTYSNNRFPNVIQSPTERESTVNRQEQSKQLKIDSHSNQIFKILREESKETPEEPEGKNISSNFTSIVKAEDVKNVFLTGKTENKNAEGTLNTERNLYSSGSVEDPNQVTRWPETQIFSESSENVRDLNEQVLTADQKPTTQTSFPPTTSRNTVTNSIKQEEIVTKSENSSKFSITFPEIYTTPQPSVTTEYILEEKLTRTDSTDEIMQETGFTEQDLGKIRTFFPDTGLTMPIFTEITDYPLAFDLLTTIKKDQEAISKNSRKMHFDQETQETTTSDYILDQRRSDILIDESLDDYILDDTFSTLNYLELIKQNGSLYSLLNSTSDSIIQLIPLVSNDLREGKISPEDVSTLSKVFGKYWTTVLAFTNLTNLDMLPLLKMKNENDLKNVLNTFFPKNFDSIGSETKEVDHDNYVMYDYEDEYKNEYLNENQEKTLQKKEKREPSSRYKKNVEDVTYESTKLDQNVVNNYEYYEKQRREDGFTLEFTDLSINVKNITSSNKMF